MSARDLSRGWVYGQARRDHFGHESSPLPTSNLAVRRNSACLRRTRRDWGCRLFEQLHFGIGLFVSGRCPSNQPGSVMDEPAP